jgi:polysaccharide pyruvyl transferase WcaK-like protein
MAPRSDPVEVLHVASFVGNIGDNANHNGTRAQLRQNVSVPLAFENTEIRKYYQNYTKPDRLSFDEQFVRRANNNDLVVVGGGSFFDIWLDTSATGTTIDLSPAQIDQIDTPIVFHGLGCVPALDVTTKVVDRFRRFLEHLFETDHTLVSVRNDGSTSRIAETVGTAHADAITTIPDGAFFVDVDSTPHPELPGTGPVLGINVVSDMRERRFPGGTTALTYDEYVREFANFVDSFLDSHPEFQLVFIPHIYSDLTAVADVLAQVDIFYRRNRITTAPYLHGMGAERHLFDVYDTVDLSMGLRFHSNVCPIGLATPSIGLANGHPKVNDLYHELGYPDRTVSVHQAGFADRLLKQVEQTIANTTTIQDQYTRTTESLRRELAAFHAQIGELIRSNSPR